jgi:long-chain acyl-CoA synthetase
MPGYIENDTANAEAFENGWFKTGDIGCLDKYGRLQVKGRMKQVIVLDSGKNVYPDELEDLYMQNDEILNAAVFEYVIKDKIVPFAVFQVKPGTTIERVALLLKKSNLAIAQYKWVKHFAITEEELPSTSAKKVKHFMVRDMLNHGAFTRAQD